MRQSQPRRSLVEAASVAETSIAAENSTYLTNEGEGRKSIRRRSSLEIKEAPLVPVSDPFEDPFEAEDVTHEQEAKDVTRQMDHMLVSGGDNHLTTASASFGDKVGRRVPEALGLAELKQRWAGVVKQKTEKAQSIDQELEDAEAEIFGDIRDRRRWPKSALDPRTKGQSWRDVSWEQLTRSSGPPAAKNVVIGAKPWVPWGGEELSEEEAKPPMLMSSSLVHAGLSLTQNQPAISSTPPGPTPTAWPTVAEQWMVSLEKELANDLAVLEARREAERGGGQTLRRPCELSSIPQDSEP